MKVTIPDCGKGLNKDLLPAELELGMWSDAQNFRFRDGFAEKWEGVSSLFTATTTPGWFRPFRNTSNQDFIVYGGTAAYAKIVGSTEYTITRYTVEQTISTLNRLGANSAEVTTSTAHGLTTGDKVTVFGATESGYNEVETSITVTSTTKFTYVTTNAIAANATVVGSYIVSEGAGTTAWSTSESWSSDVLNGFLFINRPLFGLYYWTGDTSKKFRKLNFQSYSASAMCVFGYQVILFAPYISGTKYDRRVMWSDSAEPGALPTTFESANTNDAGFVDLPNTNSYLVGGLPMAEVCYVYTSDSRYSMRRVDNSAVFDFDYIEGEGLHSRRAVVNTPKGQVFLTTSFDVRIHQGGPSTSIASGVVHEYIKSTMITGSGSDTYEIILCANPRKNEVWVCYTEDTASFTSGVRGRILTWNWETGRWGSFLVPSTGDVRHAVAGFVKTGSANIENALIVSNGTSIGVAGGDRSSLSQVGTWFGTSLTGTLERTGIHLDDRDGMKCIHRSRWNIDGDSGETSTIYHGSSKYADTAPSYTSGTTLTLGTSDYVDGRSTMGRFLAIKYSTTNYPIKVRSIDLDVTGGAKR